MNAPAAAAPAPAPAQMTGGTGAFQPLHAIWRHKLLALLVAIIVATGGTFVAYIKGTAVYAATAVIYVAPRFANILTDSKELEFQSNSQYEQFVKQQVRTINRYDIVLEALMRLGERRFALWQEPDENDRHAAERLQGALAVRDVRDTYLITVGLESKRQEGLQEIVNSVVKVYLEKTKGDELFASDQRIAVLREHRKARIERIAELTKRRSELSETLGVTTFVEGIQNPYDALLIQAKGALNEAERDRIRAEAALTTYDRSRGGAAASRALAAAAGEVAARDAGLNSLKANLYQRRSQLLEQTTGLGAEHPVRRKAARELEDLEAEVQRASAALVKETSELLLEQRRAQVREAQTLENVLRSQVQAQQDNAAWFSEHYNEALDVSDAIARERKALDAIDDRVEFLELEASAPGFVRVSNWALEPILPVAGGRTKLAVVFAVLGGILGLVAALAVDILDRRVRTARQVQALVGIPPLASFLTPSNDPAHRALMLDQMRRLALALLREHMENGVRRVLVTSSGHGCGATTVLLDLALELNRQGLRTLVVEANLLLSDPRYRGDQPRPGLVDVLTAGLDPMLAVVPGDESLPDRVSTGNPSEQHIRNCHRLPEICESFSVGYDMMLVDAAPIRLSADTEYMASICDATWLVVRAMHAHSNEVKGAAARLARANPPAVGLIMTGLTAFLFGGYYSEMIKEYRKHLHAREGQRPEQS